MNETKHITEAAGPNGDLSHLGTDSNGKRWEDYDYIKVPLANGKTGIIDVEKLSRRLETKVHFRLQDLYVMYQAVSKLNMILVRVWF